MARHFDWSKPRDVRSTWAYIPTAARPQYKSADWAKAKTNRQIRDLDEHIKSGREWLATIPSTDPRHQKWSVKLATLRLLRARLTHIVQQHKMVTK